MPDWLVIATGIVVAVGASFACVAVINRAKQRPDPLQAILDRPPMLGKDFFDQYYAEFPRTVVFQVRSQFASLTGVPADFLLPQDSLAKLAPAGACEAMRGYILKFGSGIPGTALSLVAPEGMATLDEYIRAAADLCSPRAKARADD